MLNVTSTLLNNTSSASKKIILLPLNLQQEEAFIKSRLKPTIKKINLHQDPVVSMSSYEHKYAPFKGDAKGAGTKVFLN